MNASRGDYVLATKWADGDPGDHFVIGFVLGFALDRILVGDERGRTFRATGFRRAERISPAEGRWLLAHIGDIESGSVSVWHWLSDLRSEGK